MVDEFLFTFSFRQKDLSVVDLNAASYYPKVHDEKKKLQGDISSRRSSFNHLTALMVTEPRIRGEGEKKERGKE